MARETGWLQQPLNRVLTPLMRRAWDLEITGLHHIPTSGPALLTPNHLSFIDSVFVMSLMPRRTLAVGKADYMDSWKTRYFFPATGMIPLDRSGGAASQVALDAAAASLERGDLFLIYPEGTRTRDGYLHKGRTGAARLALRTGAPIIPIGLVGTDRIQPPDRVMPKLRERCEINIGAPIDVSHYRDEIDNRLVLRQITDEMMFEISELSGQTYVDVYSGDALPDDLHAAGDAVDLTTTSAPPPPPDPAPAPIRTADPAAAAQ
ncbi:MAG: lysophospholipid acyltransferase family protein [Acidimicrobiales bacterium]